MHWDDLRFVLALHRNGTLAGAARSLGVSHVTVFRRIEAIEKSLGVRLFDRKQRGYAATSAGADLVEQAGRIEEQIKTLERRVWRHDSKLTGTVRIATTDTLMETTLPPLLVSLRLQHPDLCLELLVANEVVNITKRDADIAVRPTTAPSDALVGYKVAPFGCAVYASNDFARKHLRKDGDLGKVAWVSVDDSLSGHRFRRWITDRGYLSNVVIRSNSFMAQASAIAGGLGVGIISCTVADHFRKLVRVSPLLTDIESELWILTHPELRTVARVMAAFSHLRNGLADLRARLAGA